MVPDGTDITEATFLKSCILSLVYLKRRYTSCKIRRYKVRTVFEKIWIWVLPTFSKQYLRREINIFIANHCLKRYL